MSAAPVYAEPLAFAQTQNAFVAPVVPQIASVRPLIVSQAPRPVAGGGGGFGRFLVGLALLAGVSVTLYRNDVVRDVAHSLHQDGQYARLQAALGGPSFGTLASLEQSSSAADRITVSSLSAALAAAPATADEPRSAPAIHEPSPAPAPSPASTGSAPPVVSLESLKREGPGAKAAVATTSPEAPAAVAKPAAQPKPPTQASPTPAFKAAVAKTEPVAKPAPVEKAPPPKNEADMTPRDRLNAAISASMMSSPPSPKKGKAKAGSEYDPLNPKL